MVDIQKKTNDWGPLMWEYSIINERVEIFISCSHQELHLGRLTKHHISPDGTVSPSVLFNPCGWHEFVKLVGWNHGDHKEIA